MFYLYTQKETNKQMHIDNQHITPEETINEVFFEHYIVCAIENISLEELSEEQYKDNEHEIKDFLLVCFKMRIPCFQAQELLTNLSKNFI